MNYAVFMPPASLKELVQCYWALESSESETTPKEYFLMADSCFEIIFQYNGGFQAYSKQSARMRFQHTVHDKFVVAKELGFFGVRLYPHAVSQLLQIPASEVVNLVFDFASLFKQDGRDLADQIFSCTHSQERIDLVSSFLLKVASAKKVDPIRVFVNEIIAGDGHVDISHLLQQSGLSVKQFERRFKASAGFSPKHFARVVRFQATKRKYRSTQIKSLTDLAYVCNYFDQSHFIREFKEFSGVQPLHYFKLLKERSSKFTGTTVQAHNHDGYLPCGWFV